jgi:hypothetical protein
MVGSAALGSLTQVNASATPTTKPLIGGHWWISQSRNHQRRAVSGAVSEFDFSRYERAGELRSRSHHTAARFNCLPHLLPRSQVCRRNANLSCNDVNDQDITAQDYLVYLGNITTPAFGGGGTTGGGGGNGPPGGTCFSGNTLVITRTDSGPCEMSSPDGTRCSRSAVGARLRT